MVIFIAMLSKHINITSNQWKRIMVKAEESGLKPAEIVRRKLDEPGFEERRMFDVLDKIQATVDKTIVSLRIQKPN